MQDFYENYEKSEIKHKWREVTIKYKLIIVRWFMFVISIQHLIETKLSSTKDDNKLLEK